MPRTALELSAEELRAYGPTPLPETRDPERWSAAWELAKRAARLLTESFGATRVVAFGSLAHRESFHRWSDVDLAVWGIPADQFYRAAGEVAEMDATIPVDLVDPDCCPDRLRERIDEEGVALL